MHNNNPIGDNNIDKFSLIIFYKNERDRIKMILKTKLNQKLKIKNKKVIIYHCQKEY